MDQGPNELPFFFKSSHIEIVVFIGHDKEMAIGTFLCAERDMNVKGDHFYQESASGSSRTPRFFRFRSLKGSSSSSSSSSPASSSAAVPDSDPLSVSSPLD